MNVIRRQKHLYLRLTLTVIFIAICTVMHGIASTTNLVLSSGFPVLVYNVASLPFYFLFAASCYSFGAVLVPSVGLNSKADILLLRSITGFSLFSFLGYALGLAQLLTNQMAIGALALPLLFFPQDSISWSQLSRNDRLKALVLTVVVIYLYCFSGILFVYIESDFALYYPAYDLSLAHGDLLPNSYFWTYFFTKGCGANYIAMAATSRLSIQIVTFYAFTIIGLLTYRICSMMTGNQVVAVATALLLLATKLIRAESYRGHASFSMLLLSVPYIMARLHFGPETLRTNYRYLLAFFLCTAVLLQVSTAAFLAIPLLYFLGATFLGSPMASPRVAIGIAAAPVITFFAMIVSNYFISGIPELTPLNLMMSLINYDKVSEWTPPYGVFLSIVAQTRYTEFDIKDSKLPTLLLNLGMTAFVIVFFYRRFRLHKPFFLKRLQIAFGPLLALGIACPIIDALCKQASLSRYIIFYSAVQPLYVTTFVLASCHALVPWLQKRFPRIWSPRKILTILFSIIACYALVFNWTPKLKHQAAYTRYFFGYTPLGPVIPNWYEPEIDIVNSFVPDSEMVLALYNSPYSIFINSNKFLHPLHNQYIRNFSVMLGANAEAAAKEYTKQGILHFIVDLSPTNQMVYQMYSELFTAESISRHFRVKHLGKQKWLLTLNGSEAEGRLPNENFLREYAFKRNNELQRANNDYLPDVLYLRRHIPAFALPDAPK